MCIYSYSSFWHKTTMIDEYLDIVSDICASRNVTYINLRQPYLQNVPIFKGSLPGFSYSRLFVKAHYFVSEDGEHPNFRGNSTMSDINYTHLSSFLHCYNIRFYLCFLVACSIIAEKFASLLYTWFYSSC